MRYQDDWRGLDIITGKDKPHIELWETAADSQRNRLNVEALNYITNVANSRFRLVQCVMAIGAVTQTVSFYVSYRD